MSDYAHSYGDVMQSPDDVDGGIYLLEEAGRDTDPYLESQRRTREQPLSGVRMRDPRVVSRPSLQGARRFEEPNREDFIPFPRPPPVLSEFERYSRDIPGYRGLRSDRRDRPPIERVAWDERPRRFRPDDGPVDSEFYPPPAARPPGGTINPTPTQMNSAPSNSWAVDHPAGLSPLEGIGKAIREGFTAGKPNDNIMAVVLLFVFIMIVALLVAVYRQKMAINLLMRTMAVEASRPMVILTPQAPAAPLPAPSAPTASFVTAEPVPAPASTPSAPAPLP